MSEPMLITTRATYDAEGVTALTQGGIAAFMESCEMVGLPHPMQQDLWTKLCQVFIPLAEVVTTMRIVVALDTSIATLMTRQPDKAEVLDEVVEDLARQILQNLLEIKELAHRSGFTTLMFDTSDLPTTPKEKS